MSKNNIVTVKVTSDIDVHRDIERVFQYFSDIRLDSTWRKEINETEISDPLIQLHTIAKQTSFLSKKVPAHIALLKCTEFLPNHLVVYETVLESNIGSR